MHLADIGNTRIHLYKEGNITHLLHKEGLGLELKEVYYINVKKALTMQLREKKNWIDISCVIELKGSYETMGVDRKALCLSYQDGLFISAGTAITVDVVEEGVYKGGFILLGLRAFLKAYKEISSALDIVLNEEINLTTLPKSTIDSISYGIIAPIKAIVLQNQKHHQIYITGGDGAFLSSFFENSIYDESLIFKGMKNALDNKKGKKGKAC